jgi:uncharacterized repeat protein (TIGR03803 family)
MKPKSFALISFVTLFTALFLNEPLYGFQVLVSFNGTDGSFPFAGLVLGSDGNFYGTTYNGGASAFGTAFKMTPAGVLTTLVSFNNTNGSNPVGGLVQGTNGNFYGTTLFGGTKGWGTVFSMTPAGVLTTLVSFNGTNGRNPYTGLAQGSDGNFYGTTYFSPGNGGFNGPGTVFSMTPAGVLTTLVSFNNTNGSSPQYAALVQGTNGNLYGTTPYDTIPYGGPGNGTVFSMTSAGLLTTLTVFNSTDGANPYAGLVQGTDGNFYGTTSNGGTNDNGTVFSMTSTGVLTTLVSFNGTNGSNPYAGLLQASDGNFYGTTLSGGNLNLNNGSGDGC